MRRSAFVSNHKRTIRSNLEDPDFCEICARRSDCTSCTDWLSLEYCNLNINVLIITHSWIIALIPLILERSARTGNFNRQRSHLFSETQSRHLLFKTRHQSISYLWMELQWECSIECDRLHLSYRWFKTNNSIEIFHTGRRKLCAPFPHNHIPSVLHSRIQDRCQPTWNSTDTLL